MIRTTVIAASMLFAQLSGATELYATHDSSTLRDSAVPGEYFFKKGVEAVKANDYRHAVAMYKVAASWAYKPAEYNLGVIFAKGEGDVPVDLPQSYAWLVLAAERGDDRYVAASNKVKASLSPEDLQRSDDLVLEMKKTYGDDVALHRAKTHWHQVLTNATGTNVGFTGNNMQVGQASGFRGNPTQGGKAATGKKGSAGVSGINSTADIIGGSGTDGSIAYRDLRATDNPYDPRFNVGVITVGEPKTVDPKDATKPKSDDDAEAQPPKKE